MIFNVEKTVYLVTIVVVIALSSKCNGSNTCKGCTDLDELTFEKLMNRFPVTIVKFDIAYPYGDQHEAYSRFAQGIISTNIHLLHSILKVIFHIVGIDVYHIDDLLVAAVGIKDYGEMDNKNLSKRFNVPEKLPSIKLFQNGDVTKWLDYSDSKMQYTIFCAYRLTQQVNFSLFFFYVDIDVKTEELKQFVRRHSHIYIGLSGCIKEFDEIANEFVNNYSTKSYELALKKANKLIDSYDDEKVSLQSVYVRTWSD